MTAPDRRPSIRDVARRAGVSHTMVSFILNGKHPGAPETRARVMEAVEHLGYQPDALFRKAVTERARPSSRRARTQILAFLMPRWIQQEAGHDDGYYSRTLAGVVNAAQARGYEILLSPQDQDHHGIPGCIRNDQVDGVLLDGSFTPDWLKLITERLPCVHLNRYYPGTGALFVTTHWQHAAQAMVDHAWEMGHRNFAYFGIQTDATHLLGTHEHFLEALREKGGQLVHPELSRLRPRGLPVADSIRAFVEEWLRCDPRPTVALTDDVKGFHITQELTARGLRVPEDLSLVGRLGHLCAQLNTPPLTSYEYPIQGIAQRAVGLLVDAIEKQAIEPAHLMLEGRLIERASVRRLATP